MQDPDLWEPHVRFWFWTLVRIALVIYAIRYAIGGNLSEPPWTQLPF